MHKLKSIIFVFLSKLFPCFQMSSPTITQPMPWQSISGSGQLEGASHIPDQLQMETGRRRPESDKTTCFELCSALATNSPSDHLTTNQSNSSNKFTIHPTSDIPRNSKSLDPSCFVSILEGMGSGKRELGLATICLTNPVLVLCQFSDTSTYYPDIMTKLMSINPSHVIRPDTGITAVKLYENISSQLKMSKVQPVQMKNFNASKGLLAIKQLLLPEFAFVELKLHDKFYCLAAANALIKHVELMEKFVFARKSLRVEYQVVEQSSIIGTATTEHKEVMSSQREDKENAMPPAVQKKVRAPRSHISRKVSSISQPTTPRILLPSSSSSSSSTRDLSILLPSSSSSSTRDLSVHSNKYQLPPHICSLPETIHSRNIAEPVHDVQMSKFDFDRLVVLDILPQQYSYRFIKCELEQENISTTSFDIEIRLNVSTDEGVKTFLQDFNSSSGCTYNMMSGRQDRKQDGQHSRSKLRGFRKCCLNVSRNGKRAKQAGKNTNCESTINFRLENPLKSNSTFGEKFHLWVKIHFFHNHALNRAEYLRYLSVSEETKRSFTELFESDFTPSEALTEVRRRMKAEFPETWPEKFADKSKLPGMFWVHYWYRQWLDSTVGSRDGVDALEKAEQKVKDYDDQCKKEFPLPAGESYAMIAQTPEGQTVVAIVNPFMRRVHEIIPQSGELILMDATSNLDRNDSKLFHLYCPSSIGGLPVAELITTREDAPTITFALNLLKSVLPAGAFYGRGIKTGPVLFMTDDCEAETKALSTVWPLAERLLCHFHLLQAQWTWLWSAKHGVQKEDKAELLKLFRKVVYARSEEELQDRLEELYSDPVALKYPQYQLHLKRDTLPRIDRWSLVHRVSQKLPTSNFNTTNLVESSFR